ncbi:MAG: PrsW family intramembrane metalloprotease [Spirochaetaceae bacterium]|jgi:hypothetical protein|nr:PrsW family intramembrane metalloprotease [Spirochaetaceae bacterium]
MMKELLFVFVLILPLAAVYIWYRIVRVPLKLLWFFAALGLGVAALVIAAFVQYLFFLYIKIDNIFFLIFVRTALVEEAARFGIFTLLFAIVKKAQKMDFLSGRFAASSGLVSALSFAALESAWYSVESAQSSALHLAILRLVTSVPLHAACGSRAARAAYMCADHKNRAAPYLQNAPYSAPRLFVMAVMFHGLYNYFVVSTIWTVYLAPLLALSVFVSEAVYISKNEYNYS